MSPVDGGSEVWHSASRPRRETAAVVVLLQGFATKGSAPRDVHRVTTTGDRGSTEQPATNRQVEGSSPSSSTGGVRPAAIGMWRSLEARVVRVDEAGGSNPLIPTTAP